MAGFLFNNKIQLLSRLIFALNNYFDKTHTMKGRFYNLRDKLINKIFVLILFIIPFINCSAQKVPEPLSKILDNAQLKLPTDKIFLHTDRNLYRPGDTIYFQSYIENRFTQKFKTSSLSSWVLLLDSENNKIDSVRFRIDYSMAPGWLAIPKDCLPGWYRIKTFTSQMQNYNPHFAFSMWIRIDEMIKESASFDYFFNRKEYGSKDTVELSLELSDPSGELLQNTSFSYSTIVGDELISTYRAKTTRRGKSLLRIYLPDSLNSKNVSLDISLEKGFGELRINVPRHSENPQIKFLPEGGTFISGNSQKVAFNAVSQSGKQLYLSGVIRDDSGNFVDSLKSGLMGPGCFQVTPEKGRKYYAEFSGYPKQKWALPETSESVPAIQLTKNGNYVIVDISGEDLKEQYYLALTKNYNLAAFTPFSINKQKRVKYNTDSLPPGMARITLFNKQFKPIAERTFFISPEDSSNFKISTKFDYYLPEQQTVLDIDITKGINGKSAGLFSIAVIDSATALSSRLNLRCIKDVFFFDDAFYKRLPQHIKRVGLSNLSAEELDILLLTYGWSKFNWSINIDKEQNKLLNYDRYEIDAIQKLSARKRKKIGKTKDPFFIISVDEQSLIGITKKNNSSYILEIDSVSLLTKSVMLVPNFSIKRMIISATVNPIINTNYFDSFKNLPEKPVLNKKLPSDTISNQVLNLNTDKLIKDVSVFAKRKPAKKFANEYEERYQGWSSKTIDNRLIIETAMTLEDLLRRLNPLRLNTMEKKIYLRPSASISGIPPPALFVLDGEPQETSYEWLMHLNPNYIHSITAMKGVSGFFIYGEEALGGVVFIETKLNHIGDKYELFEEPKSYSGDLRKVINIFRAEREYYNPPKEVVQDNPEYWIRPTLYWNSEVFYDGNNPVKIQYYNHKKKGTVFVVVNGITIDGTPVSGVHKYEIK